jgi:hypothetical protein
MASQTINVRTWSKTVPSYGLRLGDLDLYVLKNHDDILRALGHERVTERKTFWTRETASVYLSLVCVFALVGGVATLGGTVLSNDGGTTRTVREADALDNDLGVPITMWCFVVVLLGVTGIAYRWLRTHRHSANLEIAYLVAAVACGSIALWQLGHSRDVDVLGFAPPSIPVWATVAAAAALLAPMLLFSRGQRVPVPRHFRVVGTPNPEQALRLIAALEPRVRDKQLDERRRAIARLRERGLIGESQSAHVASLPLGTSPGTAS